MAKLRNIFTSFGAQEYANNTGNGAVTVGFEAGRSGDLSANNFQVHSTRVQIVLRLKHWMMREK